MRCNIYPFNSDNMSSVQDLEKPTDIVQFVPPALNLGKTEVAAQLDLKPTRVKADQSSYSMAGQDTIYINLPSTECYDGRDSRLIFNATTAGFGAATLDFERNIQSIFSRAVVYCGEKVIEDISAYDLFSSIHYLCQPAVINTADLAGNPGPQSFNPAFNGVFNDASRPAYSKQNNRYAVKLHLESLKQVIPLKYLGQQLRLELTLNTPARALQDLTGPTTGTEDASITNVYFHYKSGRLSPAIKAAIEAQIASGQYVFAFRTWRNYSDPSMGTGSSIQVSIPSRYKTVCRVLAVARNSAQINDLTVGNKCSTFVGNRLLTQYDIVVNDETHPRDSHANIADDRNGTEPQFEFASVMNKDHRLLDRGGAFLGASRDTAGSLGYNNTDTYNSMVYAFDLRKVNDDDRADTQSQIWGNGVDIASPASQMQFRAQFSGGLGFSVLYDFWVQFETAIKVLPNGNVMVSSN